MPSTFNSPGAFFTGANYWASHAGTAMWSDWRPDVVEQDFQRLAAARIKVLRVFPLWSDFQPIHELKGYVGRPMEIRFGEQLLPNDEAGRAGMSSLMLDRFAEFLTLAERYEIQLIVGLITGWMSGRLFVPPALEGRNVITDPYAIRWQVRFVTHFVSRFKNASPIVAWELGNECNCMGAASSSDQAWTWTASLTNAIRANDPSRPVYSGMHSLHPDGNWTIQDQAELTDCLTTHPYPYFTPFCDQDPINTIRTGLHAVAETLYYRGIGSKTCFVEEIGTLGPMFTSDEKGADFVRNNLYTLWAHDCRGLLWWCANEQTHLAHAPYDWYSIERELGYFRLDGSPKPVLEEVSRFTEFVDRFPPLPPRIVDGVCILTNGQDSWGVAYGTFTLAKQAGLEIEFQHANQPLRSAPLYLMPSMRGHACMSQHRLVELMSLIEQGATLYLSFDNGLLSHFTPYLGVKIRTRQKRTGTDRVTMGNATLDIGGGYGFDLEPAGAEILATNQDGSPAFTCATYGKGKIYLLNYSLETFLLQKPGAFHGQSAQPYWQIYYAIGESIDTGKIIRKDVANVGITEHPVNKTSRYAMAINYEPQETTVRLEFSPGWTVTEACNQHARPLAGKAGSCTLTLPHNDAALFLLSKT
jgi:hypothetical protein